MTEYKLKYGCNPNQNPARIHMDGKELPFTVLNGAAGYINLLDAFNSWQLVKELKQATGLASAASFKHVSPAGAAVAQPLSDTDRKVCMVPDGLELSPIAQAYVRARSTDRQSSFGDFVALSDECDESVAQFLMKEVSDGIIAPSYSEKALELLKSKRRGNFLIIQIDADYVPEEMETKQVFGIKFEQKRNNAKITMELFDDMPTKVKDIPEIAKIDLLISMITLKYTQSNSVVYAQGGQTLGVGAGQQSRILCTRMAGSKADMLWLRRNEKVLNLPFILATNTRSFSQTAFGKDISHQSPNRSQPKKKQLGTKRWTMLHSAPTRSSRLKIISSVPLNQALSILHSRAAR